jgi:hypothetical protein
MYGGTDGNLEKDAKMKSHSNSDVSLFYLLGGYEKIIEAYIIEL